MDRVIIRGLKARPDLNGQVAVLQKKLPNDRVEIRVFDEVLSVKSDVAVPLPNGVDCPFDSPTLSLVGSKSWFFATGNTPAKYLLHHVPPDLEVARVLLLGCGDPRSILFTTWSAYVAGGLAAQRHIDYVCCDLEPSILARNWLLFKLCLDRVDISLIWCVFYFKKIDSKCMAVICKAASELLLYGADLDSWHQSEFGARFRFVDQASFTAVRRIWAVYAQGVDISREALKEGTPDYIQSLSLPPAVVPFIFKAVKRLHTTDIIDDYRSDGSCPRSIYKSTESNSGLLQNPLMLQGVDQKNELHHSTDPTLGYHLSLLYLSTVSSPANPSPTVEVVYQRCFQQFSEWCKALQGSVDKLTVRAFCGDALFLCYALAAKRSTNLELIPQYGVAGVHFESDTPTVFDIIDTSNLADTLGLLNLLPGCFMVTSDAPHSVVSTESLATASSAQDSEAFLIQELRTELPTFALLTGYLPHVALRTSTNFFNSSGIIQRELTQTSIDLARFRFDWRRSSFSSTIEVSEESYLQFMTNLFKKCFEKNLGTWDMTQYKAIMLQKTLTMHAQNEFASPTLQTYARLVALSIQRLDGLGKNIGHKLTDWIAQTTGLIMVSNYLQDLTCWLIRLGVISALPLCKLPNEALLQALQAPEAIEIHKSCPLVRVTLWVPMGTFKQLREYPSPDYELTLRSPVFDNKFSSIHVTGWPSPKDENQHIGISAVAPLWNMIDQVDPNEIIVALSFAAGIKARCPKILKKFGIMGEFFSAPLSDRSQVSWAYHDHTLNVRPSVSVPASRSTTPRLIAELNDYRLSAFKCTIANSKNLKILPGDDICKVVVQSPSQSVVITYPYPVDHRLIRISKDKETVTLTASPLRVNPGNLFAFIPDTNLDPTRILPFCWSMPRVLLKSLPELNLKADLDWLCLLGANQFTGIERDDGAVDGRRVMSDAFLSIRRLMSALQTALIYPTPNAPIPRRWYGLGLKSATTSLEEDPAHILIYINALRLDPTDFSVVIDVNACVLSEGNTDQVMAVADYVKGGLTMFGMDDNGLALTVKFLEAARERARNSWQHQTRTCTLLAANTCDCGRGIDLDSPFEKEPGISKVQKYFFRAALSPFFLVNTIAGLPSGKEKHGKFIPPEAAPKCFGCGKRAEKLLRCGGCQKAVYCGRDCQKQHWGVHKKQCQK